MNGPRINNDDRGVTINKTLAWSMLAFLVVQGGAGVWTVAQMSSGISQNRDAIAALSASAERQAGQIIAMQRTEARTDARLQSMEAGILRIEASVSDLVRYLREQQR